MDPEQLVGSVGIYAATLVIAVVGSVIPIVSIEVFFVGVALARGSADAVPLIAIAAIGQTIGKLPIYYASRGVAGRSDRIERIRARAARWRPDVLMATSSTFGLPPFSLLATAAGVLAVPVRRFCAVVAVGRAVRFAAIFLLAG